MTSALHIARPFPLLTLLVLLAQLIGGLWVQQAMAQCPNNNIFWTNTTPATCPGTATSSCTWGGEYITVNVVSGNTYTFSTCGQATWDTELTLYTNTGVMVGYNDDGCGIQSTVTWTATYTGVLSVILDQFPCTSNALCANISVSCSPSGPPTGPVTAGDCVQAVNICTNYSFQIDPNGFGSVNEIPPLGSTGNPSYSPGDGVPSPWGTDNWGCLMAGELNSTWMVINILTGGSLEFTFGGLGTQAGFYDWIMYPYYPGACSAISSNNLPPVRCNWNGISVGGTGLASTIPPGGSPTNFEPPLNVLSSQQYIICFSNYSSATTNVPLVFGGTAVVSCMVLPVVLLDLHATPTTNGNAIGWTTASEEASASFIIQRSMDLELWEDLDQIAAAGYSQSLMDYRFLDVQPKPGSNYYRLQMVDQDGGYTISYIVSADRHAGQYSCYPNPSQGSFRIRNASDEQHIRVFDGMGREVEFRRAATDTSDPLIELATPAPGLYSVRIGPADKAITERVLISGR